MRITPILIAALTAGAATAQYPSGEGFSCESGEGPAVTPRQGERGTALQGIALLCCRASACDLRMRRPSPRRRMRLRLQP